MMTSYETRLRKIIATADQSAARERHVASLCTDPKNIEWRLEQAKVFEDVAVHYLLELEEHLQLEEGWQRAGIFS